MKLKCLGSGSSGNCYMLESPTEALVIEAGISFKEVKKALDFNISKITGVIVGHSHGDHAKYAGEYSPAGIPVWKPYEGGGSMEFRTGNFMVRAFTLEHDVPCYGFLTTHPDMGRMVYASDTSYIKWRFNNLNHILVEANYSNDLIDQHAVNRNHVLTGHMEMRTTLEFLKSNRSPALRNVVLLHLSGGNSDEVMFRNEAQGVVDCSVYVAGKGLEIELGLPF